MIAESLASCRLWRPWRGDYSPSCRYVQGASGTSPAGQWPPSNSWHQIASMASAQASHCSGVISVISAPGAKVWLIVSCLVRLLPAASVDRIRPERRGPVRPSSARRPARSKFWLDRPELDRPGRRKVSRPGLVRLAEKRRPAGARAARGEKLGHSARPGPSGENFGALGPSGPARAAKFREREKFTKKFQKISEKL